ncbi:asparagine synthase (glutamine-hydrolyzing) [Polynucleobacter sp. MWH-HuK1]|uniref:asparagine synthase (glutamine-hydrolyzing) n=1 Tax=Polynucleobacter sp. MWH-HuK1 TaxID=1743158 RepID=UPI001C0CD5BF|nr:asparagine synthase (glutamine-hydrolyzing) [Polynucleobacter sp. MWH-HuK1]MBU3564462.1 asparagine synthase (glutamine-hydrolyzing) [Polynucleobacter sp. MWH-HuK1]
MCGIVGVASRSPVQDREILTAARDTMRHRGPDDAGIWWCEGGQVGMAHRRLAIIDLSPAGHQPMHDSTGSITIVFNGEIYNYLDLQQELAGKGHVFRSLTDTEVLLAAYREWGVDCLSRLNGMFAFALYDAAMQKVFLARDRAGEKPLFYSLSGGCLRFASELKGLLSDPAISKHLDAEAMDCFLAMGFVPGERCIIHGVKKLPPAHALTFDLKQGAAKVWKYWQLPAPTRESCQNERALENDLEALLEDAVRRQMVADVPVGVLLSGGVDSSLITAMAVRTSRHVKTFTVGFEGFGKYDETKHARLIAKHFGTEHIELNAGQVTPDLLTLLARQYDEPMIDSSMIPTYLVSKLVRQHCTVALGGDGADELFGGYAHYDRLLWRKQKIDWLPLELRKLVASSASALLPYGFRGRNWLQSLSSDLDSGLPLIATFFDDAARRALIGDGSWKTVAEGIRQSRIPMVDDLLQRATRMEFENYMPEDILVKVDRASMLNSLEIRAPMLDYRVIEFAYGRVPSHMKTTLSQRKIILKKLTSRLLPPEFDRQRKQGFSVPLRDWLKEGAWRDYFHAVLLDNRCMFDKKMVLTLLRGQDKGRNNSERLFGLVMFELWRQEYQIRI